MNKSVIAGIAAGALALLALGGHVLAQTDDPNEGTPVTVTSNASDASSKEWVQETAAPEANPAREAYVKALDSLSDEQTPMVPVVLATIGELACDGLEVDHQRAAAFISSRAAQDTQQGRKEAADNAKAATQTLLTPWLTYVQQDAGAFCEKAYALHDSGRDLWTQ